MSRPPLLLTLCLILAFLFFLLESFGFFTTTVIPVAPRRTLGIYELRKDDFSLKITNWGATITSVFLPDSEGNLDDVVLGYDGIGPYINDTSYFGALVGRVANRIGGGRFDLNGKVCRTSVNSGKHTLHGGYRGFSQVIWTVVEKRGGDFPYITMYYNSFDGEEGFPGDLDVYVTYQITNPYELTICMNATSKSKSTPVNLAQHSYWNLAGHNKGTILKHLVQIFASEITPVDDNLIPIGSIESVEGTDFDFREPVEVGGRIDQVSGGYDINYVLEDVVPGQMKKVAVVKDPDSGRVMELYSNQQGVQFYTGNFINNERGKGGYIYPKHGALCLETQGFPDAVNHPNFPSQIVRPGETYKHDMLFRFSF